MQDGYVAGVCTAEWEIAAVDPEDPNRLLARLASGEFALDEQPHLYRFEINGNQLRLFVDGEFVGEATSDAFADAGSAGVYLGGSCQVTVSTFTHSDL